MTTSAICAELVDFSLSVGLDHTDWSQAYCCSFLGPLLIDPDNCPPSFISFKCVYHSHFHSYSKINNRFPFCTKQHPLITTVNLTNITDTTGSSVPRGNITYRETFTVMYHHHEGVVELLWLPVHVELSVGRLKTVGGSSGKSWFKVHLKIIKCIHSVQTVSMIFSSN